jgi:hypothetical protein
MDEEQRKMKCFRCQDYRHHQRDCTNLPIYYKCKEEGHMAAECAGVHAKAGELKMFGFAIQDQGFYSIQIPGADEVPKTACIIQVLHGDASVKKIEDELKNLIDNKWQWHAKQVGSMKYTVVFPNKNSLDTFSKISEIVMSVHGIKVRFLKSTLDPDATEVLQPAWVNIYGLPSIAYKEEVIMKVATLAGEPLVVDELSLIKEGPTRVKLNHRDPNKLRGLVRIFFNGIGYEIRFETKNLKGKSASLPPLPLGGMRG